MKKKLPEKESSYKNIYLGEIRKIKLLANPWAKCSLIGSLIAKFFNKKNLIDSFDFQMVTSSRDLRYLRKNKNFILNTLMLFALLVSISIYRSTTINIVQRNKFDLMKIQKQDHYGKDYMGIYKKSFRNFNKNLDIFLCNVTAKKKPSKNDFISDIIPVSPNRILFKEVDNSFQKEKYDSIYDLNFYEKFLDFCFSAERAINKDCFWLRKEIFLNLRNWGESNKILVKSCFFLKKKGNSYLSNYMKFYLWQFLKNKFRHLEETKRELFTEKTSKYFHSEFNNSKLFITLEDILSDSIYQFSRYLSHEAIESDSQILNTNFLIKKLMNNDIHFMDPNYVYIEEEIKKNSKFIDFINPDGSLNSDTSKYNVDWIDKMIYLKDKPLVKPVFIHRTFLNKSSLPPKNKSDSYLDFMLKPSTDNSAIRYIINNLFSERKIEIMNPQKSRRNYSFFEPLLTNNVGKSTFIDKDFSKISIPNIERSHHLKKNIESDDIGIISWKSKKYHSNFSLNYSPPFNPAYNRIRQNYYSMNKEVPYILRKKWNRFLLEILHLLPISSKSKKLFLFGNRIELEEHLIEKNDQLDLLMDKFNGIEDPKFGKRLLLLISNQYSNESDDDMNESINDYSLIEDTIQQTKLSNFYNSIRKNYHKYFNKLLNNSYLKKQLVFDSGKIYRKKYIIHRDSIHWKIIVRKSFICDIENIKYNKLSFQVYEWFYEMNDLSNIFYLSKKFVPNHFWMNIKSPPILKMFLQNYESGNINEISNSLQIFANIRNIDVEQDQSFNESGESINQNFVTNSISSERNINNSITDSFITKININLLGESISSRDIIPNYIKNNKLFFTSNCKLIFANYSANSQSNYNERFLFHREKINIEKSNIIYLQFMKNLSKYNRFDPIIIKIKSLFLRRKIFRFAQLRLTNALSFKMLYKNFDKPKFLCFYDFYKGLSNKNNLYLSTSSNSKHAIKKIETISRSNYKFFIEDLFVKIDSEKIVKDMLVPHLNNNKIRNYYDILRSESLIRNGGIKNGMFQSINKIFLYPRSRYSKLKDFEYEVGNEILKNRDKYNQFEIYNFFKRYIPFKNYNYTPWFFTYEWWGYNIHMFVETLRKSFLIIGYYFEYFVDNNIKIIQKTLVSFWEGEKNLYNLNLKWNSRFFFDYKEKIILNSLWSDLQLINNWNSLHWVVFSFIAFISLFHQNCFSIFIGSDSIALWKHFEIIKYLTDASRAFYFTKLLHRNKTQLNKKEDLVIYFFSDLKHYARNIRFYLLTKKKLSKWLISNKSLDLSRRKRNLLVQSLITHERIKEYGFQLYPKPKILNNQLFGYRGNPQQGLSYFQYLVGIFKKDLVNYSLHLADKWIFFASLQKIISSQTLQQAKNFNSRFRKIPTPLQLGLSCSKGILLIGPVETGRSYLIKNLAADSYVPLLGISINKLLYNKPDVITESWMNILIESLRRLNLILDLAKGMSPCIIWIQNIHQLDVNRSTQNIESDPTFLLGILLKHFQTDSPQTRTKNNIIIIGSTHVPKKVDPSLISPDRLDRIINIRLFNTYQRRNQFPILLNRNNLQLKKNILYFNDLGSRTMGYNIRDLAALTNEISLISLTKNESFVCTDITKLAFHRQVLGFTHTNDKPNFQRNLKILLYKIGRAIVQNILIEDSVTNSLNISNYLWKRKFYYLSKWYLEPPIGESIIKESTILVYVLGCLAGIAARDSWFLLEKDSDTSIPMDKSVENDLDLAFSILESFSIDFSWLETCKTQFLNYEPEKPKTFLTINFLNIMQNGIFAVANKNSINTHNDIQYESLGSRNRIINRKNSKFGNTTWSPRFWRLSFSRSHLFDWIKRPNDSEFSHNFGFFGKNDSEGKNHYDQLMGRKKEQLFYERILPGIGKRNVEELESQFKEILSEEQFEIIGFFCSSTQYRMEYQLDDKPRLFIGKRILWDPIGSSSFQIRHFVFSRREFFVDEEMLRRLYVTYGVRRERERSLSSHRIKRFFICRGYNKDLINKLSVRWWDQLPIDQKQNIHTLKRIEKIGIRLKRPQIFTPVYLYQRWLIENIPEKFSRLELLTHQDRWRKINNLLLNDSFTYTILLESYQYLFEFFLSNKILLNRMTKTLLKKKWIFQNEIGDIIHNIKKY